MPLDPLQALQAANRAAPPPPMHSAAGGAVLIAGATGALGQELLHRFSASGHFTRVRLLAREPIRDGMRGVETLLTPAELPVAQWPPAATTGTGQPFAATAIVAFDPPRLYHDRERAFWAPQPGELPALAQWLRACGVRTLVIVQPHDQGRLPEALKRGLANLDEHAVVACGFERVILVRSARKPANAKFANPAERLAAWMLSIMRFMVPHSEQPVRASKVAELVDIALRLAPPGVHVAAPELVWEAAQGEMQAVARRWLRVAA